MHTLNPGVGISDVIAVMNYVRWLPPLDEGWDAEVIVGHNAAYRTADLLAFGDELDVLLASEVVLQRALRARGRRLVIDPRIAIGHTNEVTTRSISRGYYLWNVSFGATWADVEGWSTLRRGLQVAGAPWWIVRRVADLFAGATPAHRRVLLGHLGSVIASQCAGAAGIAVGAVRGAGDAGTRFTDYELDIDRPTSRHELVVEPFELVRTGGPRAVTLRERSGADADLAPPRLVTEQRDDRSRERARLGGGEHADPLRRHERGEVTGRVGDQRSACGEVVTGTVGEAGLVVRVRGVRERHHRPGRHHVAERVVWECPELAHARSRPGRPGPFVEDADPPARGQHPRIGLVRGDVAPRLRQQVVVEGGEAGVHHRGSVGRDPQASPGRAGVTGTEGVCVRADREEADAIGRDTERARPRGEGGADRRDRICVRARPPLERVVEPPERGTLERRPRRGHSLCAPEVGPVRDVASAAATTHRERGERRGGSRLERVDDVRVERPCEAQPAEEIDRAETAVAQPRRREVGELEQSDAVDVV